MAERFIYFASFGFCLCVAVVLARVLKTNTLKAIYSSVGEFFMAHKKIIFATVIITSLYSFKTIKRNADWKNNYTLYSNDVKISTGSTRINYYLGRELIKDIAATAADEKKRNELYLQGIELLEKSIAITPSYSDAYSQMGLGYSRMGNKENAVACYLNALKYSPNDPIVLNNLGAEYFTQGRYDECIDIYKKVVELDPRYVDAMVNLGSCYGTINDFDNAIYWFKKSLEVNPKNGQAYLFLSITYKLKGDNINAEKYNVKAVELGAAGK